ncbi:hypothetical protein L0128_22660, partial [candidate division KSB1 bacterium]|nr:hypothetical protein [candidate division KSB1 bacterium]
RNIVIKFFHKIIAYSFVIFTIIVFQNSAFSQFPVDNLSSRGLIAIPQSGGAIFLSWRVLINDQSGTSYKVFRKTGNGNFTEIAAVTNSSNYIDRTTTAGNQYTYYIQAIDPNITFPSSNQVVVTASSTGSENRRIQIKSINGIAKITAGDLNADGLFDYVVQVPRSIPDSVADTYKLEVYGSNGDFLWSIDTRLGNDPIDDGPIWAMAFIIWDLDGDNRAEVIARIKNENTVYLIAYDGMTGREKARTKWPDPVDMYNDRHVIAVAYMDGPAKRPSVILQVGTYWQTQLLAIDYTTSGFQTRWERKGLGDGTAGHGIDIIDYDGDSRDEIVQGANLVDEHGNLVWTTNLGHLDIMVPGDIYPDNPGFEIFYGTCYPLDEAREGALLVDLDNGNIIWEHSSLTEPNLHHIHGGWAADVTTDYPGWECWMHNKPDYDSEDESYFYNGTSGQIISRDWITNQDPIHWDDDDQKELTMRTGKYTRMRIFDFPDKNILECSCTGAAIIMDVAGDFRDELITSDYNSLYIWTNTALSYRRKISPLFDRHYRLDVARSGSGYFDHSSVLYLKQEIKEAPPNPAPNAPTGITVNIP